MAVAVLLSDCSVCLAVVLCAEHEPCVAGIASVLWLGTLT